MINQKVSLTAIVLTYNEELHLDRCLNSLKYICSDIVIVDSFSTDKTKQIAQKFKVRFFQNKWINYATQFNWGINNTNIETDWVLRIDADEYLTTELIKNLKSELNTLDSNINGVLVDRLMYFMNKPLKRGGMYPIKHLKIWRKGKAFCEQRWMDERMKLVAGETTYISGDLIDHNLNDITWWSQKHNNYATREAIDILDKRYNFTDKEVLSSNLFGTAEERRRWLKNQYLSLPLFIRPVMFFIIRYVFQLGFVEGKRGFIWSVLQCGWYRFLVDTKIYEAHNKAGFEKEALINYFKEKFNYDITKIK